jgi:hypothetical protein
VQLSHLGDLADGQRRHTDDLALDDRSCLVDVPSDALGPGHGWVDDQYRIDVVVPSLNRPRARNTGSP